MTDFPIEEQNERPKFLTVLCILSWITAGWTSVGAIKRLLSKQNAINNLEEEKLLIEVKADEISDQSISFLDSFMASSIDALQVQIDNFMLINTSNLILYSTQIFAVYLMYKLNKKGFGLYSMVQVILLFMPFVYMEMNVVTLVGTILSGIVTASFIIMYATNLKYMK